MNKKSLVGWMYPDETENINKMDNYSYVELRVRNRYLAGMVKVRVTVQKLGKLFK